MRFVECEEGLRIRFPGHDASFADGVEIGMLAAFMTQKTREFTRVIGRDNMEQARALARKMGYHLADVELVTVDTVRVTLRERSAAPKLRLVTSVG